MGKDAYWFKHDSNASRDLKLMQIKAIYGLEGLGIFWSIIEVLREQNNYGWDENSLPVLAKIIDCDQAKFNNFISDAKRLKLLLIERKTLISKRLIEDMQSWESKKTNGANRKRNPSESGAKSERIGRIRGEESKEEKRRSKKKDFVPPSLDDVKEYFRINGYTEETAVRAFNGYSEANWVDSKGNQVLNWKQKMNNVWFRDEHKMPSTLRVMVR